MAAEVESISPDSPLSNPGDDVLGYAPFAQNLANAIVKAPTGQGLVLAVFGPWGSGKSTVLNFVVHFLEQLPADQKPIIVHFNPWWFTGHEDLTRRFFDQLIQDLHHWETAKLPKKSRLLARVRGKPDQRSQQARDAIAALSKLGQAVSPAFGPLAPVVAGVASATGAAAELGNNAVKDVTRIKQLAAKALTDLGKRIVVLVDDIDRLTADEIRDIFRLIKAVGDLPLVTYLIALDKKVAIDSLKQVSSADGQKEIVSGEDYLAKIVQAGFDLPQIDRYDLDRLFFARLDTIIGDTPKDTFDQRYWANMYHQSIRYFLTSPRSVGRLCNALTVTYPAVVGEVNAVDFVAIETLRVLCPSLHAVIGENRDQFIGGRLSSGRDTEQAGLAAFHKGWLDDLQRTRPALVAPARYLMSELFPKLTAVWDNNVYDADTERALRKEYHVGSPDFFPVYFRFGVPVDRISTQRMRALLSLAHDPAAFGTELLRLANEPAHTGTMATQLLARLHDLSESDIPIDQIPPVLHAIFDVGDQLIEHKHEPTGFLTTGNHLRIRAIVMQLLRRLEEPVRVQTLRSAIAEGRAVSTSAYCVAYLGGQHGKYDARYKEREDQRVVAVDGLPSLEEAALDRVMKSKQDGTLLVRPMLLSILYFWQAQQGDEVVKEWVRSVVESDAGLGVFLEHFLGKAYSSRMGDVTAETSYRLDPKSVEPFLAPDSIIERARRLAEDTSLIENQRLAARQFVKGYELRAQGKDPSSPFVS